MSRGRAVGAHTPQLQRYMDVKTAFDLVRGGKATIPAAKVRGAYSVLNIFVFSRSLL